MAGSRREKREQVFAPFFMDSRNSKSQLAVRPAIDNWQVLFFPYWIDHEGEA
jgi:hypothetical protein